MTGFAALWQKALAARRRDFLRTPAGNYSYGDLTSAVMEVSGLLDDQGIKPGERIVIATRNEFPAITLFMGAVLHGVVPVLLPGDSGPERAMGIVAETGAARVYADADILRRWGLAGTVPVSDILVPPARHWPLSSGKPGLAIQGMRTRPVSPRLPADPEGIAYILFTSGSTRAPTGVTVSRRNLLANLATVGRVLRIGEGDKVFNDMMLAHADGLIQGPFLAFAHGAAVIRAGGFTLDRLEAWLNTVRREACTHFITVPTVWALIDRYAQHDDYFDSPEMKLLVSCAARLDGDLQKHIENRFHRLLANEYGLTETVMSALYAGPFEGMGPAGTIGRPIDCEARVSPLDTGAPNSGELQLRGDNIFPGYWNNPKRTAESFTKDGWFRTGDIVRARADGAFDYLGRIKTIINSGGLLIRPEEIDEALLSHPLVAASATVGIPDPEFGEVAATMVEVSDTVEEAELIEYLSGRLERLKLPKRVLMVKAIPRGLSGKVLTREVAEHLSSLRPMAAGQSPANGLDAGIQARVLALAAGVFRCDPGGLSLQSGPDDIAGWDSFNHMGLLMAVEEEFGLRIPLRRATGIRRLADLAEAVGEARDLQK